MKQPILVPSLLKEVYQLPGNFLAKIIIDTESSLLLEKIDLDVRSSDGKKMKHSFKRWGTKVNIDFTIDDTTPDGMSIIDILIKLRGDDNLYKSRFHFWVICK